MITRWMIAVLFPVLIGCTTVSGPRIDNIPMYGQPEIPRPDFMKRGDEAFIREAIKPFNGNRQLASKAWAMEADRIFRRGDLDFAMRRYNQAWLLDEKNYLPYWGFGQVMMVIEKHAEAIKYYENAKLLIDDDFQKPALYTDLGLAYSFRAHVITTPENDRQKYFHVANEYFQRSTELDRLYPVVWEAWANSLYHERKYQEAWAKVKKAREVGHVIDQIFLNRLTAAMPEPTP